MTRIHRSCAGIVAIVIGCGGCTTFAQVKSAEVTPGVRVDAALSLATPPGDAAAWFWSFSCAEDCDHAIPSASLGVSYGKVNEPAAVGYEIGGGVSGTNAYLQGYVQLRSGTRPFGVGARLGMPEGWREDALFARYDLSLRANLRLLVVPSLYRYGGNSPNGENPGTFTAFVQGFGLEHQGFIKPWGAMVVGRTRRESYGIPTRGRTIFVVLGVSSRFSPFRSDG